MRVTERLLLLLPVAAVALVARNVAFVSTPDLLPLWAAVPLGLLVGVLALALLTITSGSDLMDLLVSSAQIVLLSLFLMPVCARQSDSRAP